MGDCPHAKTQQIRSEVSSPQGIEAGNGYACRPRPLPWQSKASRIEYDRLISEWLVLGRPTSKIRPSTDLTVTEICAAYWRFAKAYYVKNGKATGTQDCVKVALRFLKGTYGHTNAGNFGPLALRAIQKQMVNAGQSRRYVNDNIDRIRRVFRWAVSEELIPSSIYEALKTVPNLRKGRCEAKEPDPVLPVDAEVVDATLPYLTEVVADMVRVQRLTGCRPQEICMMRPSDVDRSESVWAYRPESHKTEHHGRWRVIFVGPRAQAILQKYMDRDGKQFCFSPCESEKQYRERRNARRKTPPNHGNRRGTNRKQSPQRRPGDCFTVASYRRAIHRGCDQAFPPPVELARPVGIVSKRWLAKLNQHQKQQLANWQSTHRWSPNQLRHSAATEIRKRFGLEAVQVTLGHASADVTQIYAERDMAKARETMLELG